MDIGADGNDGDGCLFRIIQPEDPAGCLESVEDLHHEIHEDQVVVSGRSLLYLVQADLPVFREFNLCPGMAQDLSRDLPVDHDVFGDQDPVSGKVIAIQ